MANNTSVKVSSALSLLSERIQGQGWWQAALIGLAVWLAFQQIRYHKQTVYDTQPLFPVLTTAFADVCATKAKVVSVGFAPIPVLGSWIAAYRFMKSPVSLVEEGVKKTKNGLFRISTLQAEYILVTDRDKVSEFLKAPDTVLNAQDGANDQQQIPYTMGYGVGHRTYHTPVVKGVLTKMIAAKNPIMVEEASMAFDDLIGSPEDFTPIALYDTIATTVARVSNRVYVGTEFCRNEEFLRNASNYAQAVVLSAEILRVFPEWTKNYIVQLLPVMKYRRTGERMLKEFIQARLDGLIDENGNSPQDLVQWLIDAAPSVEKTVPQIAERVMALNVASIHTTTMVFTGALYTLAQKYEEYADELRQEVMNNLEDGKITTATLANLPKMESFLREGGRISTSGLLSMQRNARKEFKFSDGTVLPPGSKVGTPTTILHQDPDIYDDPLEFRGFRFTEPKYENSKEQLATTTGTHYHVFGHGRHPCPGRFFAINEMKLLFSLLLLRYDFKLAPGDEPKPFYIATMFIPDTTLKVQFKARTNGN